MKKSKKLLLDKMFHVIFLNSLQKKNLFFALHEGQKNQLSSILSTGIMFKYRASWLFKDHIPSITSNISTAVRISQGTTANWGEAFAVVLTGSVTFLWPFASFCIQLLTSQV